MSRTHSESIGLAPGPDSPPTIHPIDGSKVELAKRPKKRFEGQEFHVGIGPAQMVNAPGVILVLDAHAHFARDFLADRSRRFFSSGESTSGSDGRSWQICALTSISSLCRSCSFRNSAISRSAFRVAGWSGKDSVTVLPLSLKVRRRLGPWPDRKSTRLNSSHLG